MKQVCLGLLLLSLVGCGREGSHKEQKPDPNTGSQDSSAPVAPTHVSPPATEPVAEPGPQPTPAPTIIANSEPTAVVTPEPTPVVTPEPTPVVTPEPTPVVTPEPTPVVTPEPTPVVTPEPTPVVTPEPTPVPANEQVVVKTLANGKLHLPKMLVVHDKAGMDVDCNGKVGKLELNFNTGTEGNPFTPTVHVCTMSDRFGELEPGSNWDTMRATSGSEKVISNLVTSFVYHERNSNESNPYQAVMIHMEELENGNKVITCHKERSQSMSVNDRLDICSSVKFAKINVVANDSAVEIVFPDAATVVVPFFKLAELSSYPAQTFEGLKKYLVDVPESDDGRIPLAVSAAAGSDPESKRKFVELFTAWKDAKPGRERIYYSALGNIGSLDALPIVRSMFDSQDCAVLQNAVKVMRRVPQNSELDELMLSSIERSYARTLGWGDSDCRSIVRDGGGYFMKLTSPVLDRLKALYESHNEKNWDLKFLLQNRG